MSTFSRNVRVELWENKPAEVWNTRKDRIALFISECLYNYYGGIDSIWDRTASVKEEEIHNEISCEFYEDGGRIYLDDYEYYGSPARASQTIIEGLKKYYPDVDCCFSCQELDGDMVHDVTFEIVGGELTQKEYHYTDEEIEEYWRD